MNFDHNKFGWEQPYLSVMADLLSVPSRMTRNGVTRSGFVRLMEFDLSKGFPLLTSKKVNFDLVKAELLWFIEGGKPNGGRMNFHRLEEIYGSPLRQMWKGDMENFVSKAQESGDVGRIYGSQWRGFKKYSPVPNESGGKTYYTSTGIDQIKKLIELIKHDSTSRYMRVTAWNPAELDDMALPACHTDFQCYVEDGRLSLHMNQRSCDMFLGVPFNIASYALLCHLLAQVCNLKVGKLSLCLMDYHIYEDHIVSIKAQLERLVTTPPPQPTVWICPKVKSIDDFTMSDIEIMEYKPMGPISAPVLTKNIK